MYADDTQLCISVPAHDQCPLQAMSQCVYNIIESMVQNFTQCNAEETEVLGFNPKNIQMEISAYLHLMTTGHAKKTWNQD